MATWNLFSYVTKWVSCSPFCLALCSFGPPSHALVVITWRGDGCRYMMQLGWTVKRAQLLNIKVQVSSIWDKGCILTTVRVLTDLTWLPLFGVGRKSWYIIIIQLYYIIYMLLWRFLNFNNKNNKVIRVWININRIHVMFYSLYYAVYNMNTRISAPKYWNIFSFL